MVERLYKNADARREAGVCVQCETPVEKPAVQCGKCRAVRKKYIAELTARKAGTNVESPKPRVNKRDQILKHFFTRTFPCPK